jgi:hypothetical protein
MLVGLYTSESKAEGRLIDITLGNPGGMLCFQVQGAAALVLA